MINLIPNEEKKKMSKDFYLRLTTMSFTMLGVSLFAISIAMLPSYFIASTEKNIIDTKLEMQKKEISLPNQGTLAIIGDLNNKLNLIANAEKSKFIYSERVLNEIILKKIPSIKITEISYQSDITLGTKISISGKAPSREVLLSFRKALESDVNFSQVDLPISNFVKGSNIVFSLTLIPS
jgi:hypothetical protein